MNKNREGQVLTLDEQIFYMFVHSPAQNPALPTQLLLIKLESSGNVELVSSDSQSLSQLSCQQHQHTRLTAKHRKLIEQVPMHLKFRIRPRLLGIRRKATVDDQSIDACRPQSRETCRRRPEMVAPPSGETD